MDDAELVRRAADGDKTAYDELVLRYRAAALGVASMVAGASDVEDVVQDAFLKAYLAIGSLRTTASFRGWLLAIVANEARNHLRSLTRRRQAERAPAPAPDPGPEQDVLDVEQTRLLARAILSLQVHERVVVEQRYVFGLSEAETAKMLGVPAGTVKSRLSRALRRLRSDESLRSTVDAWPQRKEPPVSEQTQTDRAIEQAWESLGRGEVEPISEFLDQDSSWSIGGRSRVAGEHMGKEPILTFFRSLAERSEGSFTTAGVDVSSSPYHTFLCYLGTATRDGRTYAWHEIVAIHMKDGKFGECYAHCGDQYEFDDFWSDP